MKAASLSSARLLCLAAMLAVPAHGAPIEGRWLSLEGANRAPRALIEVTREGSEIAGRIVELYLRPGEDPDPACEQCPGADRGRKIRGLRILTLHREGEVYRGTVLDPEEGRAYRCVATLSPDGRTLELRGYVGVPLFGRSETWLREEVAPHHR